ncbi:MAG: ABC-type transporter, integral rane subunit [Sphingobacterium sp.]|jgi:multiple sugar transport system permease protein|nr:ABC-type transporter, integral rane subunit [Sphingobacterium sp.]
MNKTKGTIINLILALGILVVVFPFIYMILTALQKNSYVLPHPQDLFDDLIHFKFYLGNFAKAWTEGNFQRYFMNSLVVASFATVVGVFISALTAYAFARFQFPFKEPLFKIFLISMMIPGLFNIIPIYTVVHSLGLVDTYSGLLLVYVCTGIAGNTFFLRGFFEQVPREMEESVVVDGGGRWTIFRHIYLPMSKPAIATQAIFAFMGSWDEFFVALTLIKTESKRTLPIALQMFQGVHGTEWGLFFSASLIALIPSIIIFIIFQKYFVQSGQNEGAVKG